MHNHKAVGCAMLFSVGLLASCDIIQSPEKTFLKACEAEIQSRMKAPSTFKLLNKIVSVKELSLAEWEGLDMSLSKTRYQARQYLYESGKKAKEYNAYVRYEAANVYGTPIVSESVCSMISADVRTDINTGTNVNFVLKVDGKSRNDLDLSEIESLTGLRRKN